jgi:small GTP-binding protein
MPQTVKVLAVGDAGAGKTCAIARYVRNCYDSHSASTLVPSCESKTIDGSRRVQIWDFGGENFMIPKIPNAFGASAAIIFIDLHVQASFEHIRDWIERVRPNLRYDALICLVGTKSDLKPHAICGAEFATTCGLQYFETSALNGANIEAAFRAVVDGSADSSLDVNFGDYQVICTTQYLGVKVQLLRHRRTGGNYIANTYYDGEIDKRKFKADFEAVFGLDDQFILKPAGFRLPEAEKPAVLLRVAGGLASERLSNTDKCRVITQLVTAVVYLHGRGIVHVFAA